jgi:hypothetical protein
MDYIEMIESVLPEGWSVYDPAMGMDCLLECPCGNVIEQDGTCPEGCVSPLRAAGLI